MSATLLSLMIAGGFGSWVFYKFQNHSGNNTQQSLVGSGVAALVLFIFLMVVLNSIL